MPGTRSGLGSADHSFLTLIPDEERWLTVTTDTQHLWSVLWLVTPELCSGELWLVLLATCAITKVWLEDDFLFPSSLMWMWTPGNWARLTSRHQSWYWSGPHSDIRFSFGSRHSPAFTSRPFVLDAGPTSWSNVSLDLNDAMLDFQPTINQKLSLKLISFIEPSKFW